MENISNTEKSLVISLTTVPSRLSKESEDGVKSVILSLCNQKDNDYEIHFNIPHTYHVTKEPYLIPSWLDELVAEYSHLKIFRTEDHGPATKVIPTVERIVNLETIILVVDDDLIYHEDMVTEHRKYQNELNDCVIGYDGRGCSIPLYNNDIRDSWIICVTEIRETYFLQHYKSVSYKRKLFTDIFFNEFVGHTMSDDVLISYYFRLNNIKMYVVPYEKDIHLFETKQLWDQNQGVLTFPVLKYADSVPDSGANDPRMLSIQDKFFEPEEFKVRLNKHRKEEFLTDKISHGYMSTYNKVFKEIPNSKKVLEIGVYKGESLKLLSSYFKEAKIYGFDINDSTQYQTEKIITFQGNQESVEDLQNFIDIYGGDFDLIIDDGGHTMKQQQLTFGVLFKYLKNGGIYIIEDLHTSRWENFNDLNDLISTLDMLFTLKQKKELISNYITEEDKNYISQNINTVEIWTATPEYDRSVTSIIKKK
jgi:hypothetical protein